MGSPRIRCRGDAQRSYVKIADSPKFINSGIYDRARHEITLRSRASAFFISQSLRNNFAIVRRDAFSSHVRMQKIPAG